MRLMAIECSIARASQLKYTGTSPNTVPICSTAIEETTGAPQDASVTFSRCRTPPGLAVAPPWLPMAGMIAGRAPACRSRAHTVRTMISSWSIPRLPTPTATRRRGGCRWRAAERQARVDRRWNVGDRLALKFMRTR